MKYIVTINDKNLVEVEKGQATILKQHKPLRRLFNPKLYRLPAVTAAPVAPTQAAASSGSISGEATTAPMPGTILSIKVSPGTSVKKGDTLVILEAMKMENEISARATRGV